MSYLTFTLKINIFQILISGHFFNIMAFPCLVLYHLCLTIWVITCTRLSICVCLFSFLFPLLFQLPKQHFSPLSQLVTRSHLNFCLIFIVRLPFPSPGSLSSSCMTSIKSFLLSGPPFPYLPPKFTVNTNELGENWQQCLAHSELCVNVLILKTKVI